MLMSPNKDETAVHGCHYQVDMAVRMRKVLQTAGLVFECVTCFFSCFIKLTAEISENQINFLDTVVSKGERFTKDSILDIKTHYKPTETCQYTHVTSCHPPGVKKGFIKGEAMRLLRTNSSKTSFEECLIKFKQRLQARGYPKTPVERSLSGVTFASRQSALTKK